jgi:hypothetical protein
MIWSYMTSFFANRNAVAVTNELLKNQAILQNNVPIDVNQSKSSPAPFIQASVQYGSRMRQSISTKSTEQPKLGIRGNLNRLSEDF